MAKKKLKVKASLVSILVPVLFASYCILLYIQNAVGLVFVIMSTIILVAASRFRYSSVLGVVILYIVTFFQIWNTDTYSFKPIPSAGCLDICIGDDLFVWLIKGFSIILCPTIIYYAYKAFEDWNIS